MKPFKFLIPVGVAAATLIGGNAKAEVKPQQVPVVEQLTLDQQNLAGHTLFMKLSDQSILYASHGSHSSHASHASHASHSSHRSGS